MSSLAFRRGHQSDGAWAGPLAGLRCYSWRHAGLATLIGAVIFLVNLPGLVELHGKYGWHAGAVSGSAFAPIFASNVAMIAWLIASEGARWPRLHRLIVAALVTGVVASAVILLYWHAVGGTAFQIQMSAQRGKVPPPLALMFVADLLVTLIYTAIFFTVMELVRRREQTQRAFQDVLRRQADVAQQVLESRLAAMQAQVEPRFLFDSLVDIEALYAKDPAAAAALLDRLIVYLRAALPKLRGDGSTLAAEFELVEAYVAVVHALHGGRPALTITVADNCGQERFYPMLLLPLVQRAVRGDGKGPPPASIRIGASRVGAEIAIVMRVSAAADCIEDQELTRVRERLHGLFGREATLDCAEIGQASTQLTMRFPTSKSTATAMVAQPA